MTTAAIELDDFSQRQPEKAAASASNVGAEIVDERRDLSVSYWAYTSAAILTMMSFILLVSPRFILFLAVSNESTDRSLTSLERFLTRQLSFLLFATSISLILCIPSDDPGLPKRKRDALGHPLLGPFTFCSLLSSIVSYNTSSAGSLGFVFCLLTGIIGLWGIWVMLFEGTSRVSKKTGADKHTSAFLFGSKKAASSQKKEWRRSQADK